MSDSGRVKKTVRNLIYGFLSQFIVLIFNFIVRIFFIRYLGESYLGVNGLFSNILSILSLAELGFGTAMIYNLYKPLATENIDLICSLMRFYAKVYRIIGIIVFILGILILPLLPFIIHNDQHIDNISIIYLMFLMDSVLSYFFSYKRSILNADQKAYVCSQYRYFFIILKSIVQIITLVKFKNFIIYLLIQILFTFLENVFISLKVNRMYPYIMQKNAIELPSSILISIKKDINALILSKIANVALNGTDNIIITAFTSIKNTGILSNYTLISGSLTMIISQIGSAIVGSLGNFFAIEDEERRYDLFKKIDFMYFIIYGFCFICMFILYNPFISTFFGGNLIFEAPVVFIFCTNYLLEGMLQSLWSFRTTMGLFVQGKYRPLISAIINIIVSIILARYLGVFGVLLGTTISRLFVNVWYDPYIIFKFGLKTSPRNYYISYCKRIIQLFIITGILSIIKIIFFNSIEHSFFQFALLLIITVSISIILLILPYLKSQEFRYFIQLIKNTLNGIKKIS